MLARAALLALLTVVVASSPSLHGQDAAADSARRAVEPLRVAPTTHQALPSDLAHYWYVPRAGARVGRTAAQEALAQRFARGAQLIATGDFAAGLPLVNTLELAKTPLAGYAQYYTALALMGLSRVAEADETLASGAARSPEGYLKEGVPLRVAEIAMARNDAKRAVEVLDDLVDEKLVAPDMALLQLARAAERAGDLPRALEVYLKLYYGSPLSPLAVDAQAGITRLQAASPAPDDRFTRDRDRAEALFAARRWAQARAAFEPLAGTAEGDDKELVALRLAACDYYLNRFRATRDALAPLLDEADREAEVRFFHLSAIRGLGDHTTYVRLARKLVEDHPDSPFSEETLNNLATHFVTIDEDDAADQVFRQLARSFPRGRYGERSAWRIGWRAYRAGDFREAAETFERAAAAYPRADNRPAWLYWLGRARDQLDQRDVAADHYGVAIADYQNSYYGRLATKALGTRRESRPRTAVVVQTGPPGDPIPTNALIRELVALQLYDDALREVQYAQRQWGDSPQLQATVAFVRHHQGLALKAEERFAAIRGAITTMRRAYPQFMARGGEDLPPDVLGIIFPLDYWPLITKYSTMHSLDPYLIAALMAQESTFTAEIRSSANAVGLMQLIPSTGRRYARKLGIRNFTTGSLTNPETNVRLGTEYFKELMTRFGGTHYALASYNAGENRIAEWIAERSPLPDDEFIDDIPFPETQNYVKRILGTAEDYRRLYGGGLLDPNASLAARSPTAAGSKPAASPAPRRTSPPPAQPRTPASGTRPR